MAFKYVRYARDLYVVGKISRKEFVDVLAKWAHNDVRRLHVALFAMILVYAKKGDCNGKI